MRIFISPTQQSTPLGEVQMARYTGNVTVHFEEQAFSVEVDYATYSRSESCGAGDSLEVNATSEEYEVLCAAAGSETALLDRLADAARDAAFEGAC